VSCVNRLLCPLTALLVHITRSRADPAAPLFSYRTALGLKSLDHAAFVARLSRGLSTIGLDSADYNGHSLRRGGCTLCFAAGLGIVDIKLRGDWRSLAFERYVHVPSDKLFAAARTLSEYAAGSE
jgi:hypothetical protein